MRKYVILSIVILVLLATFLTGCHTKDTSYGYTLPIQGVKFGMTSNEVGKELGVSEFSLTTDDTAANSHANYQTLDRQEVLGQEGSITFSFFDYQTGELKDKLFHVTIEYNNANCDQLIEALTDQYGKAEISEQESTKLYLWYKPDLSSLPEDMVEKMRELETSCYPNLTKEQLAAAKLAYQAAVHTPLSTIRFLVTKESTEEMAEGPAKVESTAQASLQFESKYALLADLAREK